MGHHFMILISVCLLGLLKHFTVHGDHLLDPTYGFVSLPLNTSNFHVQRPYNVPEGARYSFIDGVHIFWVLASDKPHFRASHTRPRTEIGIRYYNYTCGVWQFEGYTYIPAGTSGVSIMQIFGAQRHATTLMLHVYDGALMYYDRELVMDDIYSKWLRVNVIHDVDASKVKVFIDGKLKLVTEGRGGNSHNFKFGAYSQNHSSYFMETKWKGIKVFKLHGSNGTEVIQKGH